LPVPAISGEGPAPPSSLVVRLSWGWRSSAASPFTIRLLTNDVRIADLKRIGFETTETWQAGVAVTRAGGGDVDGLEFTLTFAARTVEERQDLHSIWRYLLDHADTDTARRLRQDPGCRPDPRKLTIQMDEAGTRGFSLTVDQLLRQRVFWVPELDVFVSAGDPAVAFAEHLAALAPWRGQRVRDQVTRDPEATYADYTSRWEDLGHPAYRNPSSVWPGHIVCLTWDSAIPKFGVDRGANVWNDYGNPDRFHLGFDFGELTADLAQSWRGQELLDGLPLIVTTFEKDGVRCEVEQFAYPLTGPPDVRRGDLTMVLLEQVTLSNLTGRPRQLALRLTHRRELSTNTSLKVQEDAGRLVWETRADRRVLLSLEGRGFTGRDRGSSGAAAWKTNQTELTVDLPAEGSRALIVNLPSPPVPANHAERLRALDYETARAETIRFWSDYLARGAEFVVPEDAVNTLFRASLWHALRLPRRHGGAEPNVKIDLPYSNFAYDQRGTPWPVNQAVYVDYMLYDLRGYHGVAAEELAAMFRNNQEPTGHIGGFANWGVYTPGLIYAVAQHYLLSGDRPSFETLLPQTLQAFDWCQAELRRAAAQNGPAAGLVLAPLNDLSHDSQAWAFNQAYLFAGADRLARALARLGHPRAAEARAAAGAVAEAVRRGFARAAMFAPVVQLRDQTWIPYVPSDALTPRRLLEIWYPTDVDCGALHLSRLKALDPNGPLTAYLLDDHEDNLFFRQWGMANEPVYNQHASAYLWRDEPKHALRAFYSMLACAFSQGPFESVEHRWGWGQYFCPPSTDGAWFELYRNLLIQERDDDSLVLCAATPRRWLENGKRIRIERAPTYFGPLWLTVESRAAGGEITAAVALASRPRPAALLVRLRHPTAAPLRSVRLNGQPWTDFDPHREWIRIPSPGESRYTIDARY
jgi:hypothetical protein